MADRYALIDNVTNAWLGGPFATAPTPAAGQRVITVAIGYPAFAYWSPASVGFLSYMTQDQCLAYVDAHAATLRSSYQTSSPGMSDMYRRKMADVAAVNMLGGTTALILAQLKLMTAAQQQTAYPFLYAEMQAAGLADLTAARDRITGAAAATTASLAAVEMFRRKAKIAVRAATTPAAQNAAATGATWPT